MVRQDLDLLVPHGFQLDQGVQAVHRFPGDQAGAGGGGGVGVGGEGVEEVGVEACNSKSWNTKVHRRQDIHSRKDWLLF